MEAEPFQGFITSACCVQKQTTEEDPAVGRETQQLSLTCITPLIANRWLHYCQINNIKTANVCLSSVWTHGPAEGLSFVDCHCKTKVCARTRVYTSNRRPSVFTSKEWTFKIRLKRKCKTKHKNYSGIHYMHVQAHTRTHKHTPFITASFRVKE